MMKNILVILTFLFALVLTGCGSNSKPDGAAGRSGGIATVNYSLVAVPDVVDISEVNQTRTLKLYLNDNDALEPVEGKVIKANVFLLMSMVIYGLNILLLKRHYQVLHWSLHFN